MDRDTAVALGQQAIKDQNRRLVDAVLKIQAERGKPVPDGRPVGELPLIAVTCSTGWECYAIVEELVKTRRFRVRALYRTPGTQAAQRLEDLLAETEASHPGLLELRSGADMFSEEILTECFAGASGVVIYVTANTSASGKFKGRGDDAVPGRRDVMRQVMAITGAVKANPSVSHCVMVTFPLDKVRGIACDAPEAPWWIQQRLRLPVFFRERGLNLTCVHRPAYYYALHRVDFRAKADIRGDTALSRTMIREGNVPGINEPDYMVNWVDVRDVGKWVGTCFEYPEVFSNISFCIASCAHTGQEMAEIATRLNRHGTQFKYKPFPYPVMRMLSLFSKEVTYPMAYSRWYHKTANGYDFASNEDLADLERIHPRWSFEKKLESWGINDIRPKKAASG